jgi:microcystin degradation protein MlrC
VAKKEIYVESDGPLARQYHKLPYTKVRRPIWPLDAETRPGLIF